MRVNIQVVKSIATIALECPPLLAGALDADDAEALGQGLRVLADPTRLRILSLIRSQPDHEACVCHLTEPLGLTQPTVSHHMKVLLDAGLGRARAAWELGLLPRPRRATRSTPRVSRLISHSSSSPLSSQGRERLDDLAMRGSPVGAST
jgi:DNA-binding transcriptional ArsR family regulator